MFLKRFSAMITGGATIGGGFFSCVSGLIAQQESETLASLTGSGAVLGFVLIVIYQAVVPAK